MPKTAIEDLRTRVAELEQEVAARELDLKRFRDELGVANARLEGLIGRLQGDLNVAHAIQRVMVPTDLPHINGFEFSTKFLASLKQGGDYFDVFEHHDRLRFGVILSSSSGHATSALLLNVLLKMTGQIESRRGSEPHQVLHDMFDELRAHLGEDDQSDVFYALIDRRTYDMRFVIAGEVTALYQAAATGEVRALERAVGPLSQGFREPAQSNSLALNSNDRVVICTRGLTGALNKDGEPFGVERVARALGEGPRHGVHEIRNYLLHDVERFTGVVGAERLPRDQTVVVLEVKDKVIKLAKT